MRTIFTEPQWRLQPLQEGNKPFVMYHTQGVWVVFGPYVAVLVEVMRSEDGPVSCQVIEIFHDDGDEEVDDEERANHVESDEVNVSEVVPAKFLGVHFTYNTRIVEA